MQARRQKRRWNLPPYSGLVLLWLGVYGLTFMLFCATSYNPWSRIDEFIKAGAYIGLYIQIGYLCLRSAVAGASSIARERELQTMDTLLSSPMPMDRLIAGKYFAAAMPLLAELALALPFSWGMLANDEFHRGNLVPIAILSAACVMFFTGIGLLVSVRAMHSARAAIVSVLIVAAMLLGTFLLDAIVCGFVDYHREPLPLSMQLNALAAMYPLTYVWSYSTPHEMWVDMPYHTIIAYLVLARLLFAKAVYRMRLLAKAQ